MPYNDRISNEYFKWLSDLVCEDRYAEQISFNKLLMYLHTTRFTYTLPMDANRAEDGIDLRWRFAYEHPYLQGNAELGLRGPCSVLEMMIALALRCEETIMDDPKKGDRMAQWFWGMVASLGLNAMTDDRFDRRFVDYTVKKFLDRDYEPNGKGGLFTIRNCDRDLRTVEIWYQLNWYLDTIS